MPELPVVNQQHLPKKSCMITLMFEVIDDETPLLIKQGIDELVSSIKNKRYTFQIDER